MYCSLQRRLTSTFTHRLLFLIALCSAMLGSALGATSAFAATSSQANEQQVQQQRLERQLERQRDTYTKAKKALYSNDRKAYQSLRQQLNGYPLNLYLDYFDLQRRLSTMPTNEVRQFLQLHSDSYLAARLRRSWLQQLAKRQWWKAFLNDYKTEVATTALQCQWLQARVKSGDKNALKDTEALWNVGVSQPDECDPLFLQWQNAGYRTQDLIWQRFNKAMQQGSRKLAGYLAKKLTGRYQQLAQLHLEIDRYPQRLKDKNLASENPELQPIILHGLQRLARRDSLAALYQWGRFDAEKIFPDQPRQSTQHRLALELAKDGHADAADGLLTNLPQQDTSTLAELLVQDALKQQDWESVYRRIQQLPENLQSTERWRYWRARALEALNRKEGQGEKQTTAQDMFRQLSIERSFYGFLSADRVGNAYHIGDVPSSPAPELLEALSHNPSAIRARELDAVDDPLNANREWFQLTNQLSGAEEYIALAQLAHQWGWHNKAIATIARAKYWDDLQLRFPLAYRQTFFDKAKKNQVSPLLIYAIARQESALYERARSSVGAMGLMQLMPATAKQTARKAGIAYRQQDLFSADKNIELGSLYIGEMLQRFSGNRILAAAAYNAGPHRVDRWLAKSSQQLPADIWVEVIPFKETRKYVQNVLAYSVIYGYRTGKTPALLNAKEIKQTL